jgi:small nuclear ribonucleoprotein (snRNP)-like protein
MGTRQLRLSDASQIKNRLVQLVGKNVTLVLRDNTAQTGSLEAFANERVVLRNMRLKKTEYALSNIAEIYFDTIA